MIGIAEGLMIAVAVLATALIWQGVHVVPQSKVYIVERFGRYTRALPAGLNLITPFLDRVAFRVSVLERQLPEFRISVITADNVEVGLASTVFYRITDASRSVYRIDDIDGALHTAATSIVRSAAGRLDLDALQSSREAMNQEISVNLQSAAEVWGVEITRTEITDIEVDAETKQSQRQQLNAERERRAVVARAEGDRRATELAADAQLYEAQKLADAVRVTADADAYSVKVAALAEAEQTRVIAAAIADDGQPAVAYDVLKRQVDALARLSAADNTKTLIMPTDVTTALGSLQTLYESIGK